MAEHWLRLFPKRRNQDGSPKTPSDAEVRMITSDKMRLAELRLRLSDIRWWMRCLAENIARRSNREAGCPGRFWQGRFKAQLLLDEASLLACAANVERLSPIAPSGYRVRVKAIRPVAALPPHAERLGTIVPL